MAPLIGMTCGAAGDGGRARGFRINQAYVRAIAAAGGAPTLIPPLEDAGLLRRLFDAIDGLLLPGGADIEPAAYGQPPHPKLDAGDPMLDAAELTLARWALAEGKPVLGICRGLQCLNVAAGGTLYQDIPSEIPGALAHRVEPRDAWAHPISLVPDSRLADTLGALEVPVNSLHHQAVRDLGAGLLIAARAPDMVVEAIEAPAHPFALSVQFHPEELVPGHEASQRLFEGFIAAAVDQARRRSVTPLS